MYVSLADNYDLRNAALEADMLLAIHESDNKTARDELCNKLLSTPKERVAKATKKSKGVIFVVTFGLLGTTCLI